jgi:hypothetical protein
MFHDSDKINNNNSSSKNKNNLMIPAASEKPHF